MKKQILITLLLPALLALSCSKTAGATEEKTKVQEVLGNLVHSLEQEDKALFARVFSHSEEMVNYGTDANERTVGWKKWESDHHSQWEAMEDVKIQVSNQVVYLNDSLDTAWFSEQSDWNLKAGGQPMNIKGLRLSGVLQKKKDEWRIVQIHASIPVQGQAVEY